MDDPLALLPPIGGVAFELWTTDVGYTFDSVLLGSGDGGIAAAAAYMRDTWRPRNNAEVRYSWAVGVWLGCVGCGVAMFEGEEARERRKCR